MVSRVISFVSLLLAITTVSLQCSTDTDCSLNGLCSRRAGKCICDAGWRGNDCSELDIRPAKLYSGYNRTDEGMCVLV